MTGRPARALVRRAGRKQHFATLAAGDAAWIPICDVTDVPVFGAEVTAREDWHAWLEAARVSDGSMCSRCRNPLLVAALALEEVEGIRAHAVDVAALEAEVRGLRAEVSRLTTAALAETRRHALFLRDHITFRRRAAIEDAS